MKTRLIGLSLCAAMFASQALAGGDVDAGKTKAAVCAACHGIDGIAVIPGYPNLRGQNEQYIVSSIKAYKNGQRTGGLAAVMKAQAGMLNDQDIENLAAYFSSLK